MDLLEKLPPWRKGGWIKCFLAIGIGIAAFGFLGNALKDHFDLMIPVGILVALLPTFYIFFFVGIWAFLYVLTYPIRLWCQFRLWVIARSGKVKADEEFRLSIIVKRLDAIGDWAFSRW